MQFLLFDFSATLVFLFGYLAVAAMRQRRTLPKESQRREWPRLSHPR